MSQAVMSNVEFKPEAVRNVLLTLFRGAVHLREWQELDLYWTEFASTDEENLDLLSKILAGGEIYYMEQLHSDGTSTLYPGVR